MPEAAKIESTKEDALMVELDTSGKSVEGPHANLTGEAVPHVPIWICPAFNSSPGQDNK